MKGRLWGLENISTELDDIIEIKNISTDEEEKDVQFYILDLEDEMEKDFDNGDGFKIIDKKGLDDKNERTEDGIFSPKFGSIFGDENAFKELYRCQCGELMGKFYKDETCHLCNSLVKYKDKNVKMTGWFYLENYNIIHPQMFEFLSSLIGPKYFDAILKPEWNDDDDGNPIKPTIDPKTRNILKYQHIGMIEFQNRFEEICAFFYSKKKDKKLIYEFIMENKDKVFTSALPVHALFLRPLVITDEDLDYIPVNKKYASLSTKIYNLNNKYLCMTKRNEKIVVSTLYGAQKKYEEAMQLILETISTKNGHIRNQILGSRLNHSGRFVITPLSGSKINEVEMPYLGFLAEFKPEITNILTKIMNITVSEAHSMWTKAYQKFDKRIYDVMTYIVENHKPMILLNRNPTLNFGGILEMTVSRVKADYTDLTLSIPINILNILAGDFDGDALNTVSIKGRYLADAYYLYDPRYNMLIDKNDGLFNNAFNLIKEQMISLHEFCMIPRDNGVRTKRVIKVGHIEPEDFDRMNTIKVIKVKKKKKKHVMKIKKRV